MLNMVEMLIKNHRYFSHKDEYSHSGYYFKEVDDLFFLEFSFRQNPLHIKMEAVRRFSTKTFLYILQYNHGISRNWTSLEKINYDDDKDHWTIKFFEQIKEIFEPMIKTIQDDERERYLVENRRFDYVNIFGNDVWFLRGQGEKFKQKAEETVSFLEKYWDVEIGKYQYFKKPQKWGFEVSFLEDNEKHFSIYFYTKDFMSRIEQIVVQLDRMYIKGKATSFKESLKKQPIDSMKVGSMIGVFDELKKQRVRMITS